MSQFGVSPAFVFSRHTTRFTVDDFCASLVAAHRLGFTCYQPEVYFGDTLAEWTNGGAARVYQAGRDLGLHPSQFVAHFLMERFSTPETITSSADLDLLKRAVAVARAFATCWVFTVAIGPLTLPDGPLLTPTAYADLRQRLVDKLRAYLQIVTAANLSLALEILPFSLVGNLEGFLRLADEIASPHLGINLDTGHAWAGGELMATIPARLNGRILGLHLKDRTNEHTRSLPPGQGAIPWLPFLRNLRAAGYSGSLDLELVCPPEAVDAEYSAGRDFLQSLNLD
jgi:sugar phosphate isomerase/epimerase